MAMEGELKGAEGTICSECGRALTLQVCFSGAGYYLGYLCPCCGPYSRESEYFRTEKEAQAALADPGPHLRDTGYHGPRA